MKRIKLLTPILGITTLSTVIIPLTSCAQKEHVWLSSVDDAKKTADGRLMVAYHFGLDEQYDQNDLDVIINSTNRYDFAVEHIATNNLLTVNVKYMKDVLEPTTIEFDLKISTSSWSSQFRWLKMNVSVDINTYIAQYTIIRNYFLNNEQRTRYSSYDLNLGDYFYVDNNKISYTSQSTLSTNFEYQRTELSGPYDSYDYTTIIDGTQHENTFVLNDPEKVRKYIEDSQKAGFEYTFYVYADGSISYKSEAIITETSGITHVYEDTRVLSRFGYLTTDEQYHKTIQLDESFTVEGYSFHYTFK